MWHLYLGIPKSLVAKIYICLKPLNSSYSTMADLNEDINKDINFNHDAIVNMYVLHCIQIMCF